MNQVWSTGANLTVNGMVSGGFLLTKSGAAYLALSGSNTYSGGTAISAGTLYLGQNTSAGTGAISVGGSGTLGAWFGDITLTNTINVATGATIGVAANGGSGSIELAGTVNVAAGTTTLNISPKADVNFGGSLAAGSATDLTIHSDGTGIAILSGSQTSMNSMTADNSAIAFSNPAALPTSIHAINGGYVSVVNPTGSGPTDTAVLDKITSRNSFSGVIGFDTGESAAHPHNFSSAIDLSAAGSDTSHFVDGQVRLGSATSAVLSGTITPVGLSYDFGGYGGQGGILVVQSNLVDHGGTTGVTVVSPSNSGGVAQNGMILGLQGANTFSGDIAVTNSGVILDSATAAPTTAHFNLGTSSYIGYTENAYANFSSFASHMGTYTNTSILGIDSKDAIDKFVNGGTGTAVHDLNDATVNLSGFTNIFLGSLTGATISSPTLVAPSSGALGLVNMGEDTPLTVSSNLVQANNVRSLIVGMTGSNGAVVLTGTNDYNIGTTLQGGSLLVNSGAALGSGAITATVANGDTVALAGTTNVTISNNLAVTGTLNIGAGGLDETGTTFTADTHAITLSGNISGTGRLILTTPTTLGGSNSYSGGTYVEADTTVASNSGLGTGFVNPGYGATLTFGGSATAVSIGTLSDAKNFLGTNAGTGNINLGTLTSLTIGQTGNLSYSGVITGSASIVKNGTTQLTLLGANAGTYTGSLTIAQGSIAIGDGQTAGATFSSNVAINATSGGDGLYFRPNSSQTMTYSGTISGAGAVTLNGAGNGTLDVTGGSSGFTGATNINSGTLKISADNVWSGVSATNLSSAATVALQVNGSQTFKNLNGSGKIDIASGKTLTVNSASGTTLSGIISGSGNLAKTGTGNLTLSGANTYLGSTTISGGTLVLGSGSALTAQSQIILNGGTLSLGTFSPAAFTNGLAVSANSFIDFGGGNDTLAFADSSAATWLGTVTLMNFTVGSDFLRFGSSASGLSGAELSQISLAGYTVTGLDGSGYVLFNPTAVPEPATYAAILGLAGLALAAWRRRRVA
ncbi:MAG TPA: autotransporter-associated beta strand repeat-containing protein [Lacunisphaera sp.]|nr:autotransporter-associated beta strand repeat-containing protein [Lacunisphaera sp.]